MPQFADPPMVFPPQHYAFLVDDEHFDRTYARIRGALLAAGVEAVTSTKTTPRARGATDLSLQPV